MQEVFVSLIIAAIFSFGLFVGITLPDDITSNHIEKAQGICTKANSKISKISDTKVTCENGGDFKYDITK